MQNKRFLNARQVRDRYAGISEMSLWRWVNSPDVGFPQPIKISNRNFWLEADLDAFDVRQRDKAA